MNENKILATIDLGSNSFRLLIAEIINNETIHPVDQIKETVRLALGLDQNDILSDKAQEIAFQTLKRFKERLIGFDKTQVRVVATSTLRIAKNADEFISKANAILGFDIEIISGTEEARLIYIGCMHSLSYSTEQRLVIDIGGGSTEFILGSGYTPSIMESVTFGCVSFTTKFFADHNLNETNFNTAILGAQSKIQAMEHLFANRTWVEVIGTSGTAKALYDLCITHCNVNSITLDALLKLKKLFIKLKTLDKLNIDNLKEERKFVIAAGLAIMIAIMIEFKINSISVSEGGLREGVMYDLIGRNSDNDLRITTVNHLKKFYKIDVKQANYVARTALIIYKSLMLNNKQDIKLLKLMQWATELYEIGLYISHNDYQKHGAYILYHSDLPGFSKLEQSILADLVKAHRGNLIKTIDSLKSRRKIKIKILYMILAFRLSVIFNRNRLGFNNEPINIVNASKTDIYLYINDEWLKNNPLTLFSLNEEISQWVKYGLKITLIQQ